MSRCLIRLQAARMKAASSGSRAIGELGTRFPVIDPALPQVLLDNLWHLSLVKLRDTEVGPRRNRNLVPANADSSRFLAFSDSSKPRSDTTALLTYFLQPDRPGARGLVDYAAQLVDAAIGQVCAPFNDAGRVPDVV